MNIILSQRRDIESGYSDKLFSLYHFPRKYRNQIHEGDSFIYYQGDRYKREHRYYYGTGTIGNIFQTNNDDFYAELIGCREFKFIVPIYMDSGYIEQIDFHTVRKSENPPWQSSIRPLSENAAKYILSQAKELNPVNNNSLQVELENELKEAVKSYYRGGNHSSLQIVIKTSSLLAGLLGVLSDSVTNDNSDG